MVYNPESVENMGSPIPRGTRNADGTPDGTSPGGDVGAPSMQRSDSRVVEEEGGRPSMAWPDGGDAVHGMLAMGPEAGGSADTDPVERAMGAQLIDNRPDTLVSISDNGGYTRLNTPTGRTTRSEGYWPDGGLRGAADTEAIKRMGIDRDENGD